MTKPLKKDLSAYFKQIKKCLICSKKQKREFLVKFKYQVTEYVDGNCFVDIEQVRTHFGEPKEIADAFLANVNVDDVRSKLRRRKLVTIILVVALTAITATSIIYLVHKENEGYIVEYQLDENGEVETLPNGEPDLKIEKV